MLACAVGFGAIAWSISGKNIMTEKNAPTSEVAEFSHCDNPRSQVDNSWNMRVTLNVPNNNDVLTSSTVVNVVWKQQAVPFSGEKWISSVSGEMPYVTLPDGKTLFLLMSNRRRNIVERMLFNNAESFEPALKSEIERISNSKTESRTYETGAMLPFLLQVNDFTDPRSIERYLGAYDIGVEKTTDCVSTARVMTLLPWLNSISNFESAASPTAIDDGNGGVFVVTRKDLVR